jgi:hypothetical protein
MAIKKEKAFVILTGILILLFLRGFHIDIHGDQGAVFFGRTDNYMADYYNVAKYSSARNPYNYGVEDDMIDAVDREYPPLAYVLGYCWSRTADYLTLPGQEAGNTDLGTATAALYMFSVAALFMLLIYDTIEKQKLYKILIAFCLMLSGIFIFSYERGNNIFLPALCSSFFVLNYNHKNKVIRECSYIALAIAAGIKVYPALLGLLVIFDRNYKGALRLIVYGIAFAFLPFLFFEGGFRNLPILLRNSQMSVERYSMSVFSRFSYRFWVAQIQNPDLQARMYTIAGIVNKILCCGAVAASYLQKKPWKRIMLLLLVKIMFPVNSAPYTGLYLYIGIVMFLNEEEWSVLDAVYLLLIVMILNPFQVIINGCNYTTWAMNLSASVMFILLCAETLYPAVKSFFETKNKDIAGHI